MKPTPLEDLRGFSRQFFFILGESFCDHFGRVKPSVELLVNLIGGSFRLSLYSSSKTSIPGLRGSSRLSPDTLSKISYSTKLSSSSVLNVLGFQMSLVEHFLLKQRKVVLVVKENLMATERLVLFVGTGAVYTISLVLPALNQKSFFH